VLFLQNPALGGAERSLLETVLHQGLQPLLIVSESGPWSEEARLRGWPVRMVTRPKALDALTLRGASISRDGGAMESPGFRFRFRDGFRFLKAAWLTLFYAIRVLRAIPRHATVRTLGVKSHLVALLLLPFLQGRWQVDVRDFIQPRLLRRLLGWAAKHRLCQVIANSQAVAVDYPGAQVEYPRVQLPQPRRYDLRKSQLNRQSKIIVHVGYFAPYKGQDRFLACASAWLKAGLDADFWVVGDVLYPAPEYLKYRDELYQYAENMGGKDRVKFWGALNANAVQEVLEQADLLFHCTREPEPYGRSVMEALLCGCEAICHRGSGVCEIARVTPTLPAWLPALPDFLGSNYVGVALVDGAELAEPRP
jgi:glycosyltransferase involved in cell wall biosynthesis